MEEYPLFINLNAGGKEYRLNFLKSEIQELTNYSSSFKKILNSSPLSIYGRTKIPLDSSSPLLRKLMSDLDSCKNFKVFKNKSLFRTIISNSMSKRKNLQFFYS